MKFFELLVGSIVLWIIFYIIGRVLFEEKEKKKFFIIGGHILAFSVALASINMIEEFLYGTVKVLCIYFLFCSYYKLIFKRSYSKILIASLILYICLCVSEVIVAVLASIILKNLHASIDFLKNTILINVIISLVELFIVRISRKLLIKLVKSSNFGRKGNFILIFVVLITIALLIFRIPVSKWTLDIEFLITMIILLSFCIVGILLLKQRADIQETTTMYQQLVDYSNITNDLLEDYRVVSHEQKNQLLIIRSMINEKDKELVEYVDNLLDKRVGIKYEWIGQLNYLPLSGLKGLINYKLVEMQSLEITTNISISKEISKIKLERLSTKQKDDLYSIMGVYLDNAIQASKGGQDKEISLEIYKEKNDIVIILANTYHGTIELSKLDNYGYTTKGKNHGVGLHIVQRILEEDSIFSQARNLFGEYYVQELRINIKELKNKSKRRHKSSYSH